MGAGENQGRFGELLRRHRVLAGLSQEELSARSGLSVRTIAKMERGHTVRPYRPSVQALADALELPQPEREQLTRASRPPEVSARRPPSRQPGS